MMKVCYSELDGPEGLSCRLEAAGHAGFAPAGQDIVCAGASTLMQALVYLLAGEEKCPCRRLGGTGRAASGRAGRRTLCRMGAGCL